MTYDNPNNVADGFLSDQISLETSKEGVIFLSIQFNCFITNVTK